MIYLETAAMDGRWAPALFTDEPRIHKTKGGSDRLWDGTGARVRPNSVRTLNADHQQAVESHGMNLDAVREVYSIDGKSRST